MKYLLLVAAFVVVHRGVAREYSFGDAGSVRVLLEPAVGCVPCSMWPGRPNNASRTASPSPPPRHERGHDSISAGEFLHPDQ
jgi:hypothetical protein